MSTDEALRVLEGCNWLKVSATSVHAVVWRSRGDRTKRPADVQVRLRRGETLSGLLRRAAGLVLAGHQPTRRVPPVTPLDRCACGVAGDLVWVEDVKRRMCRRCASAWITAARHNDMRPTEGDEQ